MSLGSLTLIALQSQSALLFAAPHDSKRTPSCRGNRIARWRSATTSTKERMLPGHSAVATLHLLSFASAHKCNRAAMCLCFSAKSLAIDIFKGSDRIAGLWCLADRIEPGLSTAERGATVLPKATQHNIMETPRESVGVSKSAKPLTSTSCAAEVSSQSRRAVEGMGTKR